MKVLLLNVNREGWHSGNMIYDLKAIQSSCETKVYGPGWEGYSTTDLSEIIKKLYGNEKPDIIYSYFTPNEKVRDVYMKHYKIHPSLQYFPTGFDKTNITKIFALSDFWARKPEQYSKDLYNSGFSYCFCCFAPPYSNPKDFYSFFDKNIQSQIKFIGYPRCVDSNCFKNYGLNKKYDVITVGAMWHFYSFRMMMHHYMEKNASSIGIKYHNYPHCGTDFSHTDFVRDVYAKAINESKMLLSCGGRYHLAFNKIFESMGCKTLYVGEKPYGEEELGLKDEYNYIAVDKENFIDKIKFYINNETELNKIVDNAQKTFLAKHTIEHRGKDFIKLLQSL